MRMVCSMQPLGIRAVILTDSNATVARLDDPQEHWVTLTQPCTAEQRLALAPLVAHRSVHGLVSCSHDA